MATLQENRLRLFADYFQSRASACAFGRPNPAKDKPGKRGYDYITLQRGFTRSDVERHLHGEVSIVAIPLLEDGTCRWAAIDIDVLCEQPKDGELSWCCSKSGGWHGFIFFDAPRPADRVRALLHAKAIALGFPDCEIFPKQTVAASGNGINLPFFGDAAAFAEFTPLYYTVPPTEWPEPYNGGIGENSPSSDEGYWDDTALRAMLTAYKKDIPGFDFHPCRGGYAVPCPGHDDEWEDGAAHSAKADRLSHETIVFVKNGWPKFRCVHAHCDGGCGAPKKTINDFRKHYDPLGILFDIDNYYDEWAEENMGVKRGS